MPRRKNDNDGFLAIIIVVGIIVLWCLANVIAFGVKVLLTVLCYFSPAAAGVLWFSLRRVAEEAPALPDPARHDDRHATAKIQALLADQDRWSAFHDQQYRNGRNRGLYLTRGSGETRFDERSNLGRELNRNMAAAEAEYREIENAVRTMRQRVEAGLPSWRSGYQAWAARRSLMDACRPSLLAYAGAAVILYLWAAFDPQAFYAAQAMLVFTASSRILVSPLAGASLAAGLTFLVVRTRTERKLLRGLAGPTGKRWEMLEAKWSPRTDARAHFAGGAGSEWADGDTGAKSGAGSSDQAGSRHQHGRADQEREQGNRTADAPWNEVLGVKPSASVEEIKAAYRDAIKAYHSDKVASLGRKLRELAEQESKRINVAYGEAKKARGF